MPKSFQEAAFYPGIPGNGGPPGVNAAQPAPPPPTIEDAAAVAEAKAKELRNRRGVASTVLTGPQGDTSQPLTATKALLGS